MSFSVGDLSLSQDQLDAIKNGQSVNPEEMYFQYLCTTTDGSHEPDGTPDENVRPSHAALHGTIWRVSDPTAPVPPIDWGCRCGMRYVAAPDTALAKLVDMPSAKLSKLIKMYYGISFAEYINRLRIHHFLQQRSSFDQYTLETYIYQSGFTNRSTFYAAFKKYVGLNPSFYLKEIHQSS